MDETEEIRQELLAHMPANLRRRMDAGERPMTTKEMTEQYEVLMYLAPFVVVLRRTDGRRGTLMFTHTPRYYFGWEQADAD